MEISGMVRHKQRLNRQKIRVQFGVCALLLSALITGCSPKPVNDTTRYSLLADSSRTLTVEQAHLLFQQGQFIPHKTNSLNPGFTTSYYWIAAEVDSSKSNQQVLEVGTSQLNEVIFYEIANGRPVQNWITGDYFPFEKRPNPSLNFSFPVRNGSTYLIRTNKVFESLQLTFKTVDANRYANEAAES